MTKTQSQTPISYNIAHKLAYTLSKKENFMENPHTDCPENWLELGKRGRTTSAIFAS